MRCIMPEGTDSDVPTSDVTTSDPTTSGVVTPALVAQRRRGAALEDAILAAAFAELSEAGYHAFSVESVAARAQTGKASIYRRWPTKPALVLDALAAELPAPSDLGLPPAVDDDVTTVDALRLVARAIVSVVSSPAGHAIRAVKFEAAADPALAELVDEKFQRPRSAALLAVLQRGVERGEVRPDAATPLVAEVLPAMLVHHFVMQGKPLRRVDVERIVEDVIIPLVEMR